MPLEPVKQTPIHLTDADRALAGQLVESLGEASLSALVRRLIRERAKRAGFTAQASEPRRAGRPKKNTVSN